MSSINPPAGGQKGVSLLFVVLISSVILSIGLGISSILIQQVGMISEMGHSVVSFYAADSGIEQMLYSLYKPAPLHLSGDVGNASFEIQGECGTSIESCPPQFEPDPGYEGNYRIKSIGSYEKTKRAIEIKY